MPYFHATRRGTLPSIYRHGLGGADPGPRSEECQRGVYLATDPRLCLLVMLMHYAAAGPPDSDPRREWQEWVVLVVDDARIDPARLAPDPQVERWTGSLLYSGVIDVRGAIELSTDDVMRAAEAGALPAATDQAWGNFGTLP